MGKIVTVLVMGVALWGAHHARAAAPEVSVVWNTGEISVKEGSFFSVPVEIRNSGKAVDTVRMELQFPREYMQAISVTLGELFPLVAPESHLDNTKGLISWGGFRLEEATEKSGTFATVTFRATKAGAAQLVFGANTKLYGAGKEEGGGEVRALNVRITKAQEQQVLFTLTSSSHPSEGTWERQSRVVMQWQSKESKADFQYFFAMDRNPISTPRTALPQEASTEHRMVFESVEDGVWYFHLLGKNAKGSNVGLVHYPLLIDTTPPEPFTPTLSAQKVMAGSELMVEFASRDEGSGMKGYTATIDGGSSQKAESPYRVKAGSKGAHEIKIVASDAAGNVEQGFAAWEVTAPEKGWGVTALIGLLALLVVGVIIFKLR